MKTFLKISVFLVALVVMTGCSAQKRAERHIRKAVELCPSLVQVKAHPIDTVLTVPGFADCVKMPLSELLAEDTLYAATDHGTVTAHLDLKDRTIRIGFIATPTEFHLKDTIHYAEVVIPEPHERGTDRDGREFLAGVLILFAGVAVAIYMLFRRKTN